MAQVAHKIGTSSYDQRRLNRDDIQEIASIVRWELAELNEGREENVLLLEALSNQWSSENIVNAARQRGKNWRFLAALADKMLQAQGIGLLVAISEATGMDLTEHLMRKSFSSLDRLKRIYMDATLRYGESPYKTQIYTTACQAVVDSFEQGKNLYYEQTGRSLLRLLEG